MHVRSLARNPFAVATALALAVVGAPAHAALTLDTAAITADITTVTGFATTVGLAVLAMLFVIKGIKWARRAG